MQLMVAALVARSRTGVSASAVLALLLSQNQPRLLVAFSGGTHGQIVWPESSVEEAEAGHRPQRACHRERSEPSGRVRSWRHPRRKGGRHRGPRCVVSVQRQQGGRIRSRCCADASRRRISEASQPHRWREYRQRAERLGKGRQRRSEHRPQPHGGHARSSASRFDRSGSHDQSGCPGRRQSKFAQGWASRADTARRLHPSRKDHPLRSRAHPRANRARPRLGSPPCMPQVRR